MARKNGAARAEEPQPRKRAKSFSYRPDAALRERILRYMRAANISFPQLCEEAILQQLPRKWPHPIVLDPPRGKRPG